MTKVKAIILVCFAALIGVAIWFSTKGGSQAGGLASAVGQTTVLKGVITSEKENFFKDERVKAAFAKAGYDIQVERMASGKIAQAKNAADLNNADFVFPSGIQTSEKVKTNFKGSQAYNIFYSPMVIATWTPIVDILKENKVIKKVGNYEVLDMENFMKLADNGVRWKDLKNSENYPVNKVVLVSSSDSRYSNAAKMYLALNSYVLNGHNVVSTNQDVDKVMPTLKRIIQAQGNRESSSTNMMADYMSIGRGKVPMMFAYESEFLENAFRNGGLGKDMKLIYPTPTVFTKHVMVALNPKAQELVDLLKKDGELKKLAVEYGFRFEGDVGIVEKAKSVNVNIPDVVVDVIDPPNYDVLDYMAELVEAKAQ
jgi:hypothetical protein